MRLTPAELGRFAQPRSVQPDLKDKSLFRQAVPGEIQFRVVHRHVGRNAS